MKLSGAQGSIVCSYVNQFLVILIKALHSTENHVLYVLPNFEQINHALKNFFICFFSIFFTAPINL